MLKWERIYSISYKGAERRRMWRFKQYMTKNGWITEMVKIAEPKLFTSHKTQQKKRTKKKKDTSSRLRRATPTTWSKLLATKHWISVPSFYHIKMRHIVNNTTLDLTLTRKVESGNSFEIPEKQQKERCIHKIKIINYFRKIVQGWYVATFRLVQKTHEVPLRNFSKLVERRSFE